MRFPRQECWSGLPFPSPGGLHDAGIEPMSPAWQADSLLLSHLNVKVIEYKILTLNTVFLKTVKTCSFVLFWDTGWVFSYWVWTCGPSGSAWPLLSALRLVWAVSSWFWPFRGLFQLGYLCFSVWEVFLNSYVWSPSFSLSPPPHPSLPSPPTFSSKMSVGICTCNWFPLSSLLIFLSYYPSVHLFALFSGRFPQLYIQLLYRMC